MIRRLPVVPTVIVLLAVAVMVRLGLWQLDRRAEKENLLRHYHAAGTLSSEVPYPRNEAEAVRTLYRRSSVTCAKVISATSMAGNNAKGEAGIAHIAECLADGGGAARLVIGWSRDPNGPRWQGGTVSGVIAPGPRLVIDPPVGGLQPNAIPDPSTLPNNHLAYAVQWFLFALVALVIYGFAVRKRLAAGPTPG